MNIIVDANILFSGIIKSDGKIADLLINSKNHFSFIAPEFLRYEITQKHQRLASISKLTIEQIKIIERHLCEDITFIPEDQIQQENWIEAFDLVSGIDEDDIHYAAYARQFNCRIWSGDKKLMDGLLIKGFTSFITTSDLFDLRQNL